MPNRPVQSDAATEEERGEANVRRGPERKRLEGERVEEDLREEGEGLLVSLQQPSLDTPCM